MKVYFTASARGKKLYNNNYKEIYKTIEELGYQNLDNLVLTINPQNFYLGDQRDQLTLFKNTINFIKKADIVILEVTVPSLSMGYVMNKALEDRKPVILVYLEGVRPFFAEGIQDEKLQVLPYKLEDVKQILKIALEDAKEQVDTRFTLLLPPKIVDFLNDTFKKEKIPRSVFIRKLIEKEMEKRK